MRVRVRLETTPCHLGGVRWWFICPLGVGGQPCRRRVAKLYLPYWSRYFGCRTCHDLTYTSCQEHDKRVDFYRKNPEAIRAVFEDIENGLNWSKAKLALKAMMW